MRPFTSTVILHALCIVHAAHIPRNLVENNSVSPVGAASKALQSQGHPSLTGIPNSDRNDSDHPAQKRQIHNADYSASQPNNGSNSTSPAAKSSPVHPSKDSSQDDHNKREPHHHLTWNETEANHELSTRTLAAIKGRSGLSRDVSAKHTPEQPDAGGMLRKSSPSVPAPANSKTHERGALPGIPASPPAISKPDASGTLATPAPVVRKTHKRTSHPASSLVPSPSQALLPFLSPGSPAGGGTPSKTLKKRALSRILFSRWASSSNMAPNDPPVSLYASPRPTEADNQPPVLFPLLRRWRAQGRGLGR